MDSSTLHSNVHFSDNSPASTRGVARIPNRETVSEEKTIGLRAGINKMGVWKILWKFS